MDYMGGEMRLIDEFRVESLSDATKMCKSLFEANASRSPK